MPVRRHCVCEPAMPACRNIYCASARGAASPPGRLPESSVKSISVASKSNCSTRCARRQQDRRGAQGLLPVGSRLPADPARPTAGDDRAANGHVGSDLNRAEAPLEAFCDSLNDEQKEQFNRIGPKKSITSAEVRAALPADAGQDPQGSQVGTDRAANRADRRSGEADRRLVGRSRPTRRSGRPSDGNRAGSLPGGDASDAARTARRNADAAER